MSSVVIDSTDAPTSIRLMALGTKSSDISPWVGAGLYLGNGVMSYFFTEETLKMYGCTGKKGLSKLGVATQKLTGAMMLFTGAFLAALAARDDDDDVLPEDLLLY